MPPAPTAESGHYRPYTKASGTEPLPGYRLLDPLGRGGFGEVWKCEAPGGLLKAVKFVTGAAAEDGRGVERLEQELDAFQQIKAIRHPFLLTLERVEIVAGELVMVMELADRQLLDRFRECRGCGLPGIPRDELLAYLADAAEALDVIAARHGLQHLDVKPANLFLVSGRVKVGDYGLVARLDPDGAAGQRGLTPKYVAPEALRGQPSAHSDQYSLALVYHELLTGAFPYPGRTPQQLMLQHVSSRPDLSPLPPADRPALGKALAKEPGERFGSCLGFVQALLSVASPTSLPGAGVQVRRARVERSMTDLSLPTGEPIEEGEPIEGEGGTPTDVGRPAELTQDVTVSGTAPATLSGRPGPPLPKLVAARRPGPPLSTAVPPAPKGAPPPPAPTPAARRPAVVLDPIRSVVPVGRLIGSDAGGRTPAAEELIRAVVGHAARGAHLPQLPGDLTRLPDGTWASRFPSTVPAQVAFIKLVVLHDLWGLSVEEREPGVVVLRKTAGTARFWGPKKVTGGLEVTVRLPPAGRALGEVAVAGGVFGTPDKEFTHRATDILPEIIRRVRRDLANVDDRRQHPRVAAGFGVALYPIHSDGGVAPAVAARCKDVSLGGLCAVTADPLPTRYAYAAFDIGPAAGHAVLVRFLRSEAVNGEYHSGGQYRTDL